MEELIQEIREEYQIPPYFSDFGLLNYVKEGMAKLESLNPGCNLESDCEYRGLLKMYVYYAYHHKQDEWRKNYGPDILSWQLKSEVKGNATT